MVSLHKILEHPKGTAIAERFIERNRTGSFINVKDEETVSPTCCRHCQLTLQLDHIASSQCDTNTGCLDLQYQIQHLMEHNPDSSDDTENIYQITRPRFFTLSPTAQCNFVSLLHHYVHQIPPALLEQFIAIVKPRLHSESTNNVDWCAFLIQNLELKMIMPADTQPSLSGSVEMKTSISEDTLEKIKVLASSFQTSSSSSDAQDDDIQQMSKLARNIVTSVWAQEERSYSAVETSGTRFTGDATLNVVEECVEVSRPPRKTRKLDVNDDDDDIEDHLVSSPLKKRIKLYDDDVKGHPDPSPPLAQMTTQATEVTDISDDVLEAAQMTWQKWLDGKTADEEYFHRLVTLEQTKFTKILNHQVSKTLEALPGDAVPALVENLIQTQYDISYINAVSLLKLTALPTIAGMGPSAHRLSLISALSRLLTALPHQTIDGLLCPLMQDPHFEASQAVCKLVKEKMSEEQRNIFWRNLIDFQVNTVGDPYVWSEHTVAVTQALIDKKITLDSHGVEKLMSVLNRSAADLTKSVKFGCFVKDLCSRYSKIMSPVTASLLDIALSHKSSLKNLLMKTIKKLA